MTIVDYLTDIIADTDRWEDWDTLEFEDYILDDIEQHYKLTDKQYYSLRKHLAEWLEKDVFDDLAAEVKSIEEDAREWAEAKRSAIYG